MLLSSSEYYSLNLVGFTMALFERKFSCIWCLYNTCLFMLSVIYSSSVEQESNNMHSGRRGAPSINANRRG